MQLDKSKGLIDDVEYFQSPNFNRRPQPDDINLIVIHSINLPPGQFDTQAVIDLFTNQLQSEGHPCFAELTIVPVSAHILITRGGDVIQFVPFHLRAWHAGVSNFQGREGCNDYSIGIELEGVDDIPYEKAQYQSLANLSKMLIQAYNIPLEHIVGHCDVASDRKTDPGPSFDWRQLRELMDEIQ